METDHPHFWIRVRETSGIVGGVAVILLSFASQVDGTFDWSVFALSGLALFLVWVHTWILVPEHLRHEDAEDAYRKEFRESDWRFVDALSGLDGAGLDHLRAVFREGDDQAAREFIKARWGGFDGEDRQEFIRFFNDKFMDTVSVYVDSSGRLRPFED